MTNETTHDRSAKPDLPMEDSLTDDGASSTIPVQSAAISPSERTSDGESASGDMPEEDRSADPLSLQEDLTANLIEDLPSTALQAEGTGLVAEHVECSEPELTSERGAAVPPLNLTALSEEAFEADQAGLREDQDALGVALEEVLLWSDRGVVLLRELGNAIPVSSTILVGSREVIESLPPELQEKLQGRQQGLELIEKMLGRLPDHPLAPRVEMPPNQVFVSMSKEEWGGLLAVMTEEQSAQKAIDQRLKKTSIERYKALSGIRDRADGARKCFLSFVEKQVLPVLDGIDEGARHSETLIGECKPDYSDHAEALGNWFTTYAALREQILAVLEQVGIRPMIVETGKPIDYDLHEPFDVEPDPELPDETVKAVSRRGYELSDGDEANSRVLRPAQVIVVKN